MHIQYGTRSSSSGSFGTKGQTDPTLPRVSSIYRGCCCLKSIILLIVLSAISSSPYVERQYPLLLPTKAWWPKSCCSGSSSTSSTSLQSNRQTASSKHTRASTARHIDPISSNSALWREQNTLQSFNAPKMRSRYARTLVLAARPKLVNSSSLVPWISGFSYFIGFTTIENSANQQQAAFYSAACLTAV